MSLKERLFGPAWESKDADARRRAVTEESDARLFRRLPEIAAGDPEPAVRLAALKRLNDETAWLRARSEDSDPGIRDHADRALLQLVGRAPAADGVEARLEWLSAIETPDALRRVAEHAADTALRRAALGRIRAQGFLGDRAVAEPDDELAGELIRRIDQTSTLKRIAKAMRTRHKQRHRAVMERLAELEQLDHRHETRDELALQLVGRMERLARGESGGDRNAEIARLTRRWDELGCDDPALTRRFHGAHDIVRSAMEERAAPAAAAPSDTPDAAAADAELARLAERTQRLAASPIDDDTAGTLHGLLSAFDRRWNDLKRAGEADRALRTRFDALVAELQARLASRAPPQPAPAERVADAGAGAEREAAGARLDAALQAAEQALASGDIRESHAALRALRQSLDAWPGKRAPHDASARLARMAAQLKEMRDWQHWSNNELRERLIERARAIDPAELHPDAVTARLKELRSRWKELDRLEILPGDKRRFAAPRGQWRRFQKACKEAFDAARPYLEKRNEVREQSQRDLDAFLEDARSVVADEDVPADRLVRYQRAARQAIRNLDALPPKTRSRSAGALRELMDAISAALDRRFEAVENEKRRLVAEARKLAHETDRRAAVDRAKALQAEWKRAGRGRRKVEEPLWREFREPIDPLFEELDRERGERRRARHEHAQELERLCREAEALADGDDPDSATGPLARLEDEFNAHESVPSGLRQRFAAALEAHRGRLRQLVTERETARAAQRRALADALQQAGEARLAGGGVDGDDPDPPPEDDELARELFERLQALRGGDIDRDRLAADAEAATDRARRVVIEMEFLSGLETPDGDRKLRMDYQVERLSSRLGQGAPRPDLDSERAALQRRWLECLPLDAATYAELQQRFEAADAILRNMTAGDR
jgi:hypothetical protein